METPALPWLLHCTSIADVITGGGCQNPNSSYMNQHPLARWPLSPCLRCGKSNKETNCKNQPMGPRVRAQRQGLPLACRLSLALSSVPRSLWPSPCSTPCGEGKKQGQPLAAAGGAARCARGRGLLNPLLLLFTLGFVPCCCHWPKPAGKSTNAVRPA